MAHLIVIQGGPREVARYYLSLYPCHEVKPRSFSKHDINQENPEIHFRLHQEIYGTFANLSDALDEAWEESEEEEHLKTLIKLNDLCLGLMNQNDEYHFQVIKHLEDLVNQPSE